MNFFAKMNMLMEEARRNRNNNNRFNPQYSAFPNTYNPCSTDDFVSDEMSGYENINYFQFDGFKNGSKDFGSTRRGRKSQHRDKWAGRGGPNGGYHNLPERGGHLPNHDYHKFPEQHIKGGRRANFKRSDSQESTSKQGPDVPVEFGETGPVGVGEETSPPMKDLNAMPIDFKRRRREKNKLRKLRQKERRAAGKSQAEQEVQLHLTPVTSEDVDGATAERQQIKPELETRKRKKRQMMSADDEPKLKIVKTKTSGVSKDSRDKMEAESAVTLKTASNSEAKGQSSVLRIKEEPAQLKVKPQEKTIPLSESARHPEETNKDSTSAPLGSNTVEQNSCSGAVSSAQTSTFTADEQNCTEQSLEAKTDQVANSSEQQSRQIRNQEKRRIYGRRISAHRLTFVCRVCKFSSFYKWKLKAHLKSKFHKDHFKFLAEHLPKSTVDFLKTEFSKKQQRVQDLIDQIPDHRATLCQVYEDQDLTLDISKEHFIRKEEAAHCLACAEYIPMQYCLIQLHLQSPDHRANCKGMMVQSKNLGLSTVQRLLRLKCTRQKLECYLKDSGVMEPIRNHKKVQSTQKRAVPEADMMTQGVESPCERAMQADEAEDDGKDLVEEPVCEHGMQADETEEKWKHQEVESPCEQAMQADETEEKWKHQEVESPCEQAMQADEVARKKKDLEEEPFCERMIQADKTVEDRKAKEVEPLSKGVIPATDPAINREEPMCEESIPATEILQEPEQSEQKPSRFDFLDEENDLEGVELGEEEMGEDGI